jgi:thiamine biosynthesis lipoprotein
MDTTIKFSAYGDKKVLKGAKKVLTDLEKKVSVTDSGSEIYHINQNGSGTLTGDVSDLMQKALQMCTQTDGALDISIYPIVKAWGFTTGDYQVPDESTIQSLLPMVDYTKVEFDKTTGNVTIPSGMTIDLGSIAKGYAGQ